MSSERHLPDDLLVDSEATLRLVDSLLEELRSDEDAGNPEAHRVSHILSELSERPAGLSTLPIVMLRAYREIVSALDALKRSRSVFERVTIDRVQETHQKLREVSSATEIAATDMLDGLDRAAGLLDRLDAIESGAADGADEEAATLRSQLREEIDHLMSCLQFQDITSQQLHFAASVLHDIEQRLSAITDLFDRTIGIGEGSLDADGAAVAEAGDFDPGASMLNAEGRQAMADEIFSFSDPDPEFPDR